MRSLAAKRSVVGAVMLIVAAVVASLWSTSTARADSVPHPGNPGPLFSPALSASSFSDPGAALRPKFRWWQPVADTTDAQVRTEVHNMAADGGGGFEQNGFPATMNGGGMTPQFSAFANSQQFGAIFGWGTPAWSERTATYQSAAGQDGVIGDMNEGSRWNNTVPAVFSQNQPAAAQQLVFGDTQLKPGDKPGAELPPIISTTTTTSRGPQTTGGLSGVSTTLCRSASPGDRNLQTASIAGLLAGDHIILGSGPAAETATIAHVGTASPCVPLSQPASAGDSVIHVPLAPSDLSARNAGSTSANLSPSTGVPGTGMQPGQFVAGEKISLGNGSTHEEDTIASVGTFDMGPPTTLAADAPAGATNVKVTGNSGFLRGDTVTIDPGQPDQQSRIITSVGAAGTGTTLSQSAAAGDLGIRVASTTGLAAGNKITVDPGRPDAETLTIASVSTAAAPAPNVLIQDATLGHSHPAGQPVVLTGIGVSFTPALSHAVSSSATVVDTGTGLKLAHPLSHAHPEGETLDAPGTGLTLSAPLTKPHSVGPNSAPETTVAAGAASGATTLEVASAAGLAAGDTLTIGSPGFSETDKIVSIAAPTSAGTELTLATPLTLQHYLDDPVVDTANRSGGTTTLAAASFPGQTNIKLASVAGLSPGDIIDVGNSGSVTELATIAAGGVGTAGATGTGVTLTTALSLAHAAGQQVTDNPAANDSAGLSDIAVKRLVAVEFAQCADSSSTACPSAATGGTRDLDPSTVHVVTGDVSGGTLHYPGSLPQGNGNPWEEIDLYQTADGQTLNGATATTPDYWLDHLSVAGAAAMATYFDDHILNNPQTQAAIRYQDQHTGTPAVFEDSLEDSQNIKWTNGMLSQWRSRLGYDPTPLLPAIAGENKNTTGTPVFDFTQNDSHGASLGWRVREDYRQMWNDLYTSLYQPTLDRWASSHGLVARFQSYGDPIDEGAAGAHEGIAEGEHLEFTGNDETQQFKVVASGTYQTGNKVVSDECCEENGDAWADTFGVDGTGSGPEGSSILSNANSVYADMAGGVSQIVWHGWPYTTGAGGRSAVWPGNTYGGDTSFSAANGPNQPQFSDDRQDNLNIARNALAIRQGQPSFDVAVYHQDLGLDGQGADTVTGGENLGNRVDNGVTSTPTTGKLIFSSSSLAQAGYTYGYVSPEFFRYPTATYGHAAGALDPRTGRRTKVLFPGHGDYRSLVIYDQSVMPVDVARRILALARQGLPVVIIGQIPDATATAAPGTVAGFSAQDAQVRAAMASLVALPNVRVVPDATAAGSQSADANAPGALRRLGIVASAALAPTTYPNTLDQETMTTSTTATPVLPMRRFDPQTGTSYYYLYNPNLSATVDPTIVLAGQGRPYTLDTWTGTASPIADYQSRPDRVRLSVRIAPGNFALIAVSRSRIAGAGGAGPLHATSTTANATGASSDNVVYTHGRLEARAARSGTYVTRLSDGRRAVSHITVPAITPSGGPLTLSDWQLWVDSFGPTPSGDPTQTAHTRIPASGSFTVRPVSGATDGSLPSWTAITPQNGFPVADNLTNVGGVGTYASRFTLPADWSRAADGAYLNIGVAVDTVDIWINGTRVTGIDQNDRNQIDVGRYLRPGTNTMTITTATPLRNAVAAAPATPATGQVPHDADPIGTLQGGTKEANIGLIGPVTLTPYGQAPL